MQTWCYRNPVDVHCGIGSLTTLPAIVGHRSAVLVTFPEAVELGFVRRVEVMLGGALRGVIAEAVSNPDVANVHPTYDAFWRTHGDCEVVIALGGGSALDTAKLLSVRSPTGQFDEIHKSLVDGRTPSLHAVKPCIAIPTTAGTGSEVTPYATLWDRKATPQRKLSLQTPLIFPEAALIDPELSLSLPATPTLHSGLDALSHSLEAIWNVNANPVADALAVEAARNVLKYLPQLMEALDDVTLRMRMATAAVTAGLAFSTTRTALAHSISYEMTMRHGLPHGLACSFTLGKVLGMAVGRDPDRDRVLSNVFDGSITGAEGQLEGFLERLGVSTDFASYGVSPQEGADMIRLAQSGSRGRNFVTPTPRRVRGGLTNPTA